uniref:Uncharacterized protein n=1 Tax=Rhizophagus irregularis (strain DAOM 181602 / DAOM 197198 / MUCL 43194) TaxID=747089 RepID=U9UCY5_RHIID
MSSKLGEPEEWYFNNRNKAICLNHHPPSASNTNQKNTNTNMPCFLVNIAGPTFTVYGAVLSDTAISISCFEVISSRTRQVL